MLLPAPRSVSFRQSSHLAREHAVGSGPRSVVGAYRNHLKSSRWRDRLGTGCRRVYSSHLLGASRSAALEPTLLSSSVPVGTDPKRASSLGLTCILIPVPPEMAAGEGAAARSLRVALTIGQHMSSVFRAWRVLHPELGSRMWQVPVGADQVGAALNVDLDPSFAGCQVDQVLQPDVVKRSRGAVRRAGRR